MSEPEREIYLPDEVRIGVWANDVLAVGDVEDVTLDFVRVEPHDRTGILVARVTLPQSCILKLRSELGGFA